MVENYELIIIGAGPAGLTASIYASRYRIKNLVIGSQLGGAMALASAVENYPGFERISGLELTQKMAQQVKALGAEIINDSVVEIQNSKSLAVGGADKIQNKFKIQNPSPLVGQTKFKIITENGKEYKARAIILATGTRRRELGVPGEKEYLGRGVSYCATCDAAFFRDKVVAVIGGANAAVMSADHLARFAKKVYLIYRRKPLRAEPIWVERVEKNPKIEIIYNTNIVRILGKAEFEIQNPKHKIQNKFEIRNLPPGGGTPPKAVVKSEIKEVVGGVELDSPYRGSKYLVVDGVFIEIGGVPGTELAKSLGVELDEKGFVKVNPDMETNVPGIFAAGDIANLHGELQQIVIACAEGATATFSAYKYLSKNPLK
jgi:thioredoxin reductase (NADPH)